MSNLEPSVSSIRRPSEIKYRPVRSENVNLLIKDQNIYVIWK